MAGHDEGGYGDAHDTGPRSGGTERLCVVERTAKPVDELIRFVVGPEGALVPDVKRKLPGRGVWVTATRAALALAIKRGAFQRSLKENIKIPANLPDQVEALLARSALDALSVAHKAGRAIAGFERVERAIATGGLAALIHAADAAPDGVRKLAATQVRHGAHAGGTIALVRAFTTTQLDLALGRPNVIHAALLSGRESDSFLARWRTLERYRTNDDGDERARAGHEAMQPRAALELGTE